jgi:hypothetical protein
MTEQYESHFFEEENSRPGVDQRYPGEKPILIYSESDLERMKELPAAFGAPQIQYVYPWFANCPRAFKHRRDWC